MTKIKKFPRANKTTIDLEAYRLRMDFELKMHELENSYKMEALELAKDYLDRINQDLGEFTITNESVSDDNEELIIFLESNKGYHLDLTVSVEGEEMHVNPDLYHGISEGLEKYNWENDEWEIFRKPWVRSAFLNNEIDDAENDLMEVFGENGMMEIAESPEEEKKLFARTCENNKAILDLRRKINRFMHFDMISCENGQRCIGLVPDSFDVDGIVVRYQNGKYVIGIEIEGLTEDIYKDMFALESVEEAARYLKACLDHYWNYDIHLVPVSPNCYAVFEENNTFVLHTINSQDPSAEEKREARAMRKALARVRT